MPFDNTHDDNFPYPEDDVLDTLIYVLGDSDTVAERAGALRGAIAASVTEALGEATPDKPAVTPEPDRRSDRFIDTIAGCAYELRYALDNELGRGDMREAAENLIAVLDAAGLTE